MAQRDRSTMTLRVSFGGTSYEVDEIEAFDYSSDVLAVGDECHVTVVNDRRKYTSKLQVGSICELHMANPLVNAGQPVLRHKGIITQRAPSFSPQGSLIKITVADLGWHLRENCAPLWYNLRYGPLSEMLDPTKFRRGRDGTPRYFLDPSWGLVGYRGSNLVNRSKKQGVALAAAQAQNDLAVFAIQVEPGDTCLDKMIEYARRYNLLINVSVDGYVQAWVPDYSQRPQHKIRCLNGDSNVIMSQGAEDIRNIWTDVECVGEQIGFEGDTEPTADNPNALKKRGAFYNRKALPFIHRLTFGDGEMFERGLAKKEAEWRYKRGIFDSWYHQYTVPEHHQDGVFWEADTMVSVQDDEIGLDGAFYVAQVRCESDKQKDVTTVVIRKPGLLSASFGIHPNPPTVRSSQAERSQGQTQQTQTKTEANYSSADQVQSR